MHRRYFLQLIFTSLLQLLIAFGVLAILMNFVVMSYIENETESTDRKTMDLIQKSVDRQFITMNNITKALVYNTAFTPYNLLDNPYKAVEAREILKSVAVANPLMEAIGTSYYRDDYLLTNETSALKRRYFAGLGIDETTIESRDALENGYVVSDHYLIFLVPMRSVYQENSGYFFYVFRRDALMSGLFPDDDGTRYISLAAGDGTVFFDNLPEDNFHPDRFIRNGFTSASTDLQYTFYTSRRESRAFINRILWLFGVSLFSALFLGAVIIYLFSRLNYTPVRHLSEVLHIDTPADAASGNKMGEFERIEKTLTGLIRYNSNPTAMHAAEIRAMRESIAKGCINGTYKNPQVLVRELENAELPSAHALFGFIRVLVSKERPGNTLSADYTAEEGGIFCLNDQLDRSQGLFLVNSPDEAAAERLIAAFKAKQENAEGPLLTIGAGRMSENPAELARSFLEASSALDYRLVRGMGKIILYQSIPGPDKINLNHIKSLLQQVRHAMMAADRETLRQGTRKILQYCADLSLSGARYVYWNLIRTIRETMESYTLSRDEKQILENLNVSRLTEFETLEELGAYITGHVDTVSRIVDHRTPDKTDALCRRIKTYIGENLDNPLLSLTDIAQRFGLSQGHLCRRFKENEGQTILRYIKDLRYDDSCRMLRETDLTVAEVVRAIGYSDSASFIREFKKRYRLTPGQYREQFAS